MRSPFPATGSRVVVASLSSAFTGSQAKAARPRRFPASSTTPPAASSRRERGRHEQRHRDEVRSGDEQHRRVQRARAVGRHLHRDGVAPGLQDRGHHRRPRAARAFRPTVKATLEVGALTETVTVTGASAELINTQTRDGGGDAERRIRSRRSRRRRAMLLNARDLPGRRQLRRRRARQRDGQRPARVVPQHHARRRQQPRQLQQVDRRVLRAGAAAPGRDRSGTVTSAAGGADVGGHGAISINFVTRQGTNRFTGSAYEYYRDTRT